MTDTRRERAGLRRRRILELSANSSFLRPADIAERLNVSGETIRRDLLALEASGGLWRVHGGALAVHVTNPTEPSRQDRRVSLGKEKQAIGEIVASLVADDDVVFFDVGTTVEVAAESLPATFGGTVITNSLAVGAKLNDRRDIEVILLGGRVRAGEMTTHGPDTVSQLENFSATVAFLGSGGVDLGAGMTDYSTEDVAIKQLMMKRAGRTYILATGDKFGRRATRFVCALQDVTGIISDGSADAGIVRELDEAGVAVLHPGSAR